jgi:hypothetical protein
MDPSQLTAAESVAANAQVELELVQSLLPNRLATPEAVDRARPLPTELPYRYPERPRP